MKVFFSEEDYNRLYDFVKLNPVLHVDFTNTERHLDFSGILCYRDDLGTTYTDMANMFSRTRSGDNAILGEAECIIIRNGNNDEHNFMALAYTPLT